MKTAEEFLYSEDMSSEKLIHTYSYSEVLYLLKVYSNQKLDKAASYANGHRTRQSILSLKDNG